MKLKWVMASNLVIRKFSSTRVLATTDGIWPYTYNECDLGILPNQSTLNEEMSYLPGQRLSKCVCQGKIILIMELVVVPLKLI